MANQSSYSWQPAFLKTRLLIGRCWSLKCGGTSHKEMQFENWMNRANKPKPVILMFIILCDITLILHHTEQTCQVKTTCSSWLQIWICSYIRINVPVMTAASTDDLSPPQENRCWVREDDCTDDRWVQCYIQIFSCLKDFILNQQPLLLNLCHYFLLHMFICKLS